MCSDYYSRKICWKNQKFLSSIHKLLLYRISRACGHQPVLTCPVQVLTLPCPGQRVFLEICPVSCPEQGRTQDRAGSALPCGHLWYLLSYVSINLHQILVSTYIELLFEKLLENTDTLIDKRCSSFSVTYRLFSVLKSRSVPI